MLRRNFLNHGHPSMAIGYAILVAIGSIAESSSVLAQQALCKRPVSASTTSRASRLVISTPPAPACRITWISGSVAARTSDAVERVGDRLSVDRRGRFYTSTGRGRFHVWTPDGRLFFSGGERGAGPGEFASGRLGIFPSPTGDIYVLDNQRRLTVLDSMFRRRRTFTSYGGSSSIFRTAVLPDGSLLDGERPFDDTHFFGIVRLDHRPDKNEPDLVRAFGEIPATERQLPRTERGRLIAYTAGDRFWAGPPQASGRGYELQQWRTDGTLLRTVERRAAWYPSGVDRASRGTRLRNEPPGEIEALFDLGDDLLMVIARVTNRRGWEMYQRAPRDTLRRNQAFDVVVEIVDVRNGVVLASTGPTAIGEAQRVLPTGWFHGSRRGYRPAELADGEEAIETLELRLVAR